MKNKSSSSLILNLILAVFSLSLLTSAATAQTNDTFFQSAKNYFTVQNTNLSFAGAKIELQHCRFSFASVWR
jgi:hypothetical protein